VKADDAMHKESKFSTSLRDYELDLFDIFDDRYFACDFEDENDCWCNYIFPDVDFMCGSFAYLLYSAEPKNVSRQPTRRCIHQSTGNVIRINEMFYVIFSQIHDFHWGTQTQPS
jgi:hypothetical protein